ncbi:hypothetical protein [Haloarchaeobius amylolyticus]|uniref:hypothetical protein n=1 Tax=Haloarchaeobius amylolyticus TaxID=1198296 RepID=UPI00226E8787|nr:hypothetical protein [Haloarchaeobius amylolyticus]
MTGLKSGAGDDLWGDESEDEEEEPENEATGEPESTPDPTETAESNSSPSATEVESSMSSPDSDPSSASSTSQSGSQSQPYIVRRAVQDKSVQFERDERLTFFVHDDVAEGERDLLMELESKLGRDVPKFDVREAVYRAALRNRDDVLEELLKMGYALDDE